jgi:hypothetical protein
LWSLKFLKAYYGWTLLHRFGKNSKIDSTKVMFFEFMICKKISTLWNKVIVLSLLIVIVITL